MDQQIATSTTGMRPPLDECTTRASPCDNNNNNKIERKSVGEKGMTKGTCRCIRQPSRTHVIIEQPGNRNDPSFLISFFVLLVFTIPEWLGRFWRSLSQGLHQQNQWRPAPRRTEFWNFHGERRTSRCCGPTTFLFPCAIVDALCIKMRRKRKNLVNMSISPWHVTCSCRSN